MTETNSEQSLADFEAAFETSKQERLVAKHSLEAARGRYHILLTARREAGETLTVSDIKALEAVSIQDIDYVRDAYVAFITADSKYRAAKVNFETAKRNYWDGKEVRGR